MLLKIATDHNFDMIAGNRKDINVDAGRPGHAIGNTISNCLFRQIFLAGFQTFFQDTECFRAAL